MNEKLKTNEKPKAQAFITLDENLEPATCLQEGDKERLVPVRLRGDQDNLTLSWHGHGVVNLEWAKTFWLDKKRPGEEYTWILLADHEKEQCPRCGLWAESEAADEIASLNKDGTANWEEMADRVQVFYRNYVARWDEEPDALNPMLNQALSRERARVCAGIECLAEWLDLAVRYVHARMRQIWIEEDYLSMTRTTLMTMCIFGGTIAPSAFAESRFEHEGVTWRVYADGDAERRVIRDREDGITIIEWIADPAGGQLPGYHEALVASRRAVSQGAQEPGERRVRASEINMEMRERKLSERTFDVREEARMIRGRLVEVTRSIKGA